MSEKQFQVTFLFTLLQITVTIQFSPQGGRDRALISFFDKQLNVQQNFKMKGGVIIAVNFPI